MPDDKISITMDAGVAPESPPAAQAPARKESNVFAALLYGCIGAALSAFVWFLTIHYLNLRFAILTLCIGAVVGVAMRSKLAKPSVVLGIVAALITVGGIAFGQYLIWYYSIPKRVEKQLRREDPELRVQRETIHILMPWTDYVKYDLGLSGSDSLFEPRRARSVAYSWIFYALSIAGGFYAVAGKEKEKKAAEEKPGTAPPA